MAVFNPHPVFFRQAVESVLRQTFDDLELVMIEDPSPAAVRDLIGDLNDPRLRLLTNPDRTSLVHQRNRGLAEARSNVVALLDADDICEAHRLEAQLDLLRSDDDLGVVGSYLSIIDEHGELIGYRTYPVSHDAIVRAMPRMNPIAQPAVMCRRATVIDAGGYTYGRYPAVEDYELWSRLALSGVRFANIPEPLVRYRIHRGAMKSSHVHGILRGVLEIKQMHWRPRMNARDRLRMRAERALLRIPGPIVLKLFTMSQYKKRLTGPAREPDTDSRSQNIQDGSSERAP